MRNMRNMKNTRRIKAIDEEEVEVLVNDLYVFADEIKGIAEILETALKEGNEYDIMEFKPYGHDIIEVLRHVVIF